MVCDGVRGRRPRAPLDAPPHVSYKYMKGITYLGVAAKGPSIMRFYSLAKHPLFMTRDVRNIKSTHRLLKSSIVSLAVDVTMLNCHNNVARCVFLDSVRTLFLLVFLVHYPFYIIMCIQDDFLSMLAIFLRLNFAYIQIMILVIYKYTRIPYIFSNT